MRIGDIVGRFLDASGRLVEHPLNDRAISASLQALTKIPTVIVASGGQNKAAIPSPRA